MNQTNPNFTGTKVLIVNENPMNTLMGKTILTKWGTQVHTAETCQQAEIIFHKEKIDLIIVDLQLTEDDLAMKVENMKTHHSNLKCIGSHVGLEEAELATYKNSGISDFITVPFKHIDLENILSKYSIKQDLEEILYNLTKLEAMGDVDFVTKMINLFVTETPNDIALMQTALEKEDFEQVASIAHKIKPSVSYICIERLFEDVKTINAWALPNHTMIEKTNRFITEIEATFSQLKSR